MGKGWKPKNFEEACKRNAGRRKLHARKREERANRIVRLLKVMETEVGENLKENTYGWLSVISKQWNISAATASRDLACARQIRFQFLRMFGREFDSTKDTVAWSWDWSHYGFKTRESIRAGHKKPVGFFPFSTRPYLIEEEDYGGFNATYWEQKEKDRHGEVSNRELISALRSFKRFGF